MNRYLLIEFLILFTSLESCNENKVIINSPSNILEVKMHITDQGLKLNLFRSEKIIVNIDLGKFVFNEDVTGNGYNIIDIEKSTFNETWTLVYGERNLVQNNYNEVRITLTDTDAIKDEKIIIVCRVYDEGVAFQYLFDKNNASDLIIERELTSFNFKDDYEAWTANKAQAEYKKEKISKIKDACERPLVIEQNDSLYLAVGEAALVDYARMKLINNEQKENSLQVILDGNVDVEAANYKSPWRFVMVGKSPGQLLENNYFIQNLNEANKIENTDWIKPGKVIREVTLTTKGGIACVDFAAKHNLQFVEFDAGWYGNEYDDASDATTITVDPRRSPGPLDLHHIIDYADQKGIGVILYVNRKALEKQLDEILPLYKSWGIKGIKYGFVNVGPQVWTTWLHEAVRKAAEYELMVDIHDEYRPTGYQRTYPNLMTQEGIRGDEESPTTEHTLITAFTRMIAGAGDNTNCYLAERVNEKMGGKTAQMAKAIILYSPWQFLYWYDRPEASPHKKGGAGSAQSRITDTLNLDFYDQLPVVWDDTKVLEGEIGEYGTIARKKGEDWFVGSLVAKHSENVNIPLSFLNKNENYKAIIYFQDEEALKNNRVNVEVISVNRESVLSKDLPANAGMAIIINKL